MATVVNTRDVLLLAASPRLLWTGVRGVTVVADTTSFKVTAGTPTPSTINFTATLNGVNGTVVWSVPFGTATLTPSGTTCTLTYANMSSNVITVRATVTDGGVPWISNITITKVSDGSTGATGSAGATGAAGDKSRIAYTLIDGFTLSASPSTSTVSGDSMPVTGTWGEARAWTAAPSVASVGQAVFQSTGTYNPTTNQTTWVVPYLSNLKVGTLSAIVVNTGTLTVDSTGYVRGGQTGYNTGTGFWLGYDSGLYKFSIGSSSQNLTWDGSSLSLTGKLQVATAAVSGTTMTGSGAQFNPSGTFALGSSAGNLSYNGTSITLNGTIAVGGSLTFSQTAGVFISMGTSGNAIYANNDNVNSRAVFGYNTGAGSSKGVYGVSTASDSYGVFGENNTGVAVFGTTNSGKAVYGSCFSSGYAGYFTGKTGLAGSGSPLELNGSLGVTGAVLISQGSSGTPAWGKSIDGGSGTTDASGNATVAVTNMQTSNFGFSAVSLSGVIITVTSVTNTGGNNYNVVVQSQTSSTGAAAASKAFRWTAIG